MKLGHSITDPATIRLIRQFRAGDAVKVKAGYMMEGRTGNIVSVFPFGDDIAASIQWADGGRETVAIFTLTKG